MVYTVCMDAPNKNELLVNLTPHAINLNGVVIPSSGVARVATKSLDAGTFAGVKLVTTTYGDVVVGLPAPKDGVMYIVSALVRLALPTHTDLASPADLVRDEKGNIVGCRALEVNSDMPLAA